jgi:hypothetical protein
VPFGVASSGANYDVARDTERHTECAYYMVCVITPIRGARFQRARYGDNEPAVTAMAG